MSKKDDEIRELDRKCLESALNIMTYIDDINFLLEAYFLQKTLSKEKIKYFCARYPGKMNQIMAEKIFDDFMN